MKKYYFLLAWYILFFKNIPSDASVLVPDPPVKNTEVPKANLASSDTSWCGKKTIKYFDRSVNNPTSWNWYFEGAVPDHSSLQNPTGIYYPVNGSFNVMLVVCNEAGCDTLKLTKFIHENKMPHVPTITANNDTLNCSEAFTYQWYYNGNPISGAVYRYYIYRQPGTYEVSAKDSMGCSASSLLYYTAVDEVTSGSWKIHIVPNPSGGQFEVTFKGYINKPVTFEIYDVTGRNIFVATLPNMGTATSIDLNYAPNGIYFLRVKTGLEIWNKKVLINHALN